MTPTGPRPEPFDPRVVAARLAEVRARVVAAGGHDVDILAVTKGFGPEAVQAAAAVGCRQIGENYAQELLAKADTIAECEITEVHFIGQLQSNKVRMLAGLVDVYQSVDRPSLVVELSRRQPGARVLFQVDAARAASGEGEPGKGGCAPADVGGLIDQATDLGLVVEGLMTVGPTRGGAESARSGFRLVRGLVDEFGLSTCSMGMSGDLEVAVEEGSTIVRVGTALFGARPIDP